MRSRKVLRASISASSQRLSDNMTSLGWALFENKNDVPVVVQLFDNEPDTGKPRLEFVVPAQDCPMFRATKRIDAFRRGMRAVAIAEAELREPVQATLGVR